MRPGDLLSTSVKFHCRWGPPVHIRHQFMCTIDLPSIFVNLSCSWVTYGQLPIKFHAAGRHSVNLCEFSPRPKTYHQILSTFRAAGRPSINFCQISVRSGELSSTSVNFLRCQEPLRQLPSTFLSVEILSINFRQFSMRPRDLPSTFHVARRPSFKF